uniref:(northern house mosquito) hypothetical protein n=1 Tax=Culex pipiens TaxID=7175 RepID=A0A8D8FUJ5_CULPI
MPFRMISIKENSDMILRTMFYLLTPHTPGYKNSLQAKSSQESSSDNQNGVSSSDSNVASDDSVVFDLDSESEDLLKYYKTPMQFGTENSTVSISQVGSTAHIPCRIHHIGEGVVSWIRRKDYHLLTVGLTTYSSDERFSATHLQNSEDWTLQIKFVQDRDAGWYECQVSTHPPTSIFLELQVVGMYQYTD